MGSIFGTHLDLPPKKYITINVLEIFPFWDPLLLQSFEGPILPFSSDVSIQISNLSPFHYVLPFSYSYDFIYFSLFYYTWVSVPLLVCHVLLTPFVSVQWECNWRGRTWTVRSRLCLLTMMLLASFFLFISSTQMHMVIIFIFFKKLSNYESYNN